MQWELNKSVEGKKGARRVSEVLAWDDLTGMKLDGNKVKEVRAKEIQYVRTMDLYEKVLIQQCYERTGKGPISTRWIDINKGDQKNPNYRSRLVAREINTCKRDDLFAATPPLEALKVILSMTATSNQGEIVMINDISRAFFHADARRELYVQLPPEDEEEGMCAILRKSLYGTRDPLRI